MEMRKLYEIYLTEDFVKSNVWLKFILKIGKLNGLFRKFKIKVKIENQVVRYFLEVNREIPSILSELPEFILREISEENFRIKFFKPFEIISKRENSIIDLYDKYESKQENHIKEAILSFRMISFNNYFSKSNVIYNKIDKSFRIKKIIIQFAT